MLDVLLAVTSLLVLIISAAIIYSLIEFRREVRVLNESLLRVEHILFPTIEKISGTIESVKEIAGKVNSIADDVKQVSGAGRGLAREIGKITETVSTTRLRAKASAEGLKAGVWVALKVLRSNLLKKGGSDNGG